MKYVCVCVCTCFCEREYISASERESKGKRDTITKLACLVGFVFTLLSTIHKNQIKSDDSPRAFFIGSLADKMSRKSSLVFSMDKNN